MPGVIELVGLLLLLLTGVVMLARWDKHPQETGDGASRNLRGLAMALICFAGTAPLTAAIALGASNKPLPVRPPGNPSSCSSTSSGDGWLIAMVLLILVAIRLGPALVGFLVARRRAAATRPVVGGRLTLVVASGCLGLVVLAVTTRVLMGGYAPADFTTYGALTPPGAKGWRARTVIRRHQKGKLRPLALGESCESDTRSSGSCMSPGPYPVDGLKAWIGGAPVNLTATGLVSLTVHPVVNSKMDPARRPHFDRMPKYARASKEKRELLLVGQQKDGSWMAVRVHISGTNVYADGAQRDAVGLLLRPPSLPLIIALMLACLGLGLWVFSRSLRDDKHQGKRRAWGRIARLGAATLCVETTMLLYGAYRIYF